MKKGICFLCVLGLLLCGLTGCAVSDTETGETRVYSNRICTDGEWVYYCQSNTGRDYEHVNSIWKARWDGSEGQELLKAEAYSLNAEDGWLYFIEHPDAGGDYGPSQIKRMRTDGSEVETLFTEGSELLGYLTVQDGWIYFPQSVYIQDGESTCQLYRMRTDGSDLALLGDILWSNKFQVVEDAIYYMGKDADTLERMRLDGSNKEVLLAVADNTYRSNPYVWDGKVYYCVPEEEWHCWDTETTQSTKLAFGSVELRGVYDGWVYYESYSDEEGLYRCRLDGTDVQYLSAIKSDDFWYYKGRLYTVVEGEDRQKLAYVLDPDNSGEKQMLPTPETPDWPKKTLDTAGNTDLPADAAPTDALVKQVCGQFWHYKAVYNASRMDLFLELGVATLADCGDRWFNSYSPVIMEKYREALSTFLCCETMLSDFLTDENGEGIYDIYAEDFKKAELYYDRTWQPTVEHTVTGCTPAGERQVTVGGTDTVAYAYAVTVQAEGSAPTDYRMELVWQDGHFVVYSRDPSV